MNKHRSYLIDSQVALNMKMFDFVRTTAKGANPDVKCDMVSAHTLDSTESVYGIKWETYKDIAAMPWAGYGESGKLFKRTRASLGGRPLVGGFMLDTGFLKESYAPQNIKSRLFAQLVNCGFGGVHIFTFEELDGVGQTAFAEFAHGVSAYEEFFAEANEIPNTKIVNGAAEEGVHVYKKDGQYLCVVANLLGSEKTVSVDCPDGMTDTYDYYAGRHAAPANGMKFRIAPYDVLLLHMK